MEYINKKVRSFAIQFVTKGGKDKGKVYCDSEDIKKWLRTALQEAYDKGYKKRDWEMKEEDKFDEAMEAHMTEQGWCCACPADLGTLEKKIKEAYDKGREDERDRVFQGILDLKMVDRLDGNGMETIIRNQALALADTK